MTKFRRDGGLSYAEAMAGVREFRTREELAAHLAPWQIVEIKPYGITLQDRTDQRNGWNTHVVIVQLSQQEGRYVIGYTDGPLP